MEELERDVAPEFVVPGAEDLAHAPGAETAEDAIAAHDVTGRGKGVHLFGQWRDRPLRFLVDTPALAHGAVEGKRRVLLRPAPGLDQAILFGLQASNPAAGAPRDPQCFSRLAHRGYHSSVAPSPVPAPSVFDMSTAPG